MDLKLIKIVNNHAIYRDGDLILNIELDNEALMVLNYYYKQPANK